MLLILSYMYITYSKIRFNFGSRAEICLVAMSCVKCQKPYTGFSDSCSQCRRYSATQGSSRSCKECGHFFFGFADTCEDCTAARKAGADRWKIPQQVSDFDLPQGCCPPAGQCSTAQSTVSREYFPMMVVNSQAMLTFSSMRPHHELLQDGCVQPLVPDSLAAFVSHQWLARSHPDPTGVQLRTLQGFLKAAAQNRVQQLFADKDWAAFKSGVDRRATQGRKHDQEIEEAFSRHGRDTPDELVASELAVSFLWIDYMSVPQDTKPGDNSQVLAIFSIPYYIEQSSFFLVLCPAT